MAKLKFEIDTEDIFQEYDYDGEPQGGNTFESLVSAAIAPKLKEELGKKFSKEAFECMQEDIMKCVEKQVDQTLRNLINEDIVIKDRWGKAEFVGSVEDYIKKQIDEKLLHPVNSSGKPMEGCSIGSDTQTWVQWSVKKSMDDLINNKIYRPIENLSREADRIIKNKIETFKSKGLNELISKKLSAVGLQ